MGGRPYGLRKRRVLSLLAVAAGLGVWVLASWWAGAALVAMGLYYLASDALPRRITGAASSVANAFAVLLVALLLAVAWNPLGRARFCAERRVRRGSHRRIAGAVLRVPAVLRPALRWFLDHKPVYLFIALAVVLAGVTAWLRIRPRVRIRPGRARARGRPVERIRTTRIWSAAAHALSGFGKEFMPPLDEARTSTCPPRCRTRRSERPSTSSSTRTRPSPRSRDRVGRRQDRPCRKRARSRARLDDRNCHHL